MLWRFAFVAEDFVWKSASPEFPPLCPGKEDISEVDVVAVVVVAGLLPLPALFNRPPDADDEETVDSSSAILDGKTIDRGREACCGGWGVACSCCWPGTAPAPGTETETGTGTAESEVGEEPAPAPAEPLRKGLFRRKEPEKLDGAIVRRCHAHQVCSRCRTGQLEVYYVYMYICKSGTELVL